jgi:hypothetical protein
MKAPEPMMAPMRKDRLMVIPGYWKLRPIPF